MSVQNIYKDNTGFLKAYNDMPYSDSQKTAILSSRDDLLKVSDNDDFIAYDIIIPPSKSWFDKIIDFIKRHKLLTVFLILVLLIIILIFYNYDKLKARTQYYSGLRKLDTMLNDLDNKGKGKTI